MLWSSVLLWGSTNGSEVSAGLLETFSVFFWHVISNLFIVIFGILCYCWHRLKIAIPSLPIVPICSKAIWVQHPTLLESLLFICILLQQISRHLSPLLLRPAPLSNPYTHSSTFQYYFCSLVRLHCAKTNTEITHLLTHYKGYWLLFAMQIIWLRLSWQQRTSRSQSII